MPSDQMLQVLQAAALLERQGAMDLAQKADQLAFRMAQSEALRPVAQVIADQAYIDKFLLALLEACGNCVGAMTGLIVGDPVIEAVTRDESAIHVTVAEYATFRSMRKRQDLLASAGKSWHSQGWLDRKEKRSKVPLNDESSEESTALPPWMLDIFEEAENSDESFHLDRELMSLGRCIDGVDVRMEVNKGELVFRHTHTFDRAIDALL